MEHLYFSPKSPGSFGGQNRLISAYKKKYKRTPSRERTLKFLSARETYTLHKPKRKKFQRNKYILKGIDDIWQADLADMTSLSRFNDEAKYILFVIDCFSKYLWTITLNKKTADESLRGIKNVLNTSKRAPENFMTDNGGEFKNSIVKKYLESKQINFYTTRNAETKASFVERSIRTIKGRIFRYLTYKNSWRYIDVLPDIVESYNNSVHRTIKMAPSDVNASNERDILEELYPPRKAPYYTFKFNVRDYVRIQIERRDFTKGYMKGWSEEIFRIAKRLNREPVAYKIKDHDGEIITGTFYEPEIQKVAKPEMFRIERIVKTRNRNGKRYYLIKWLGYPSDMSSWEPEESVRKIEPRLLA